MRYMMFHLSSMLDGSDRGTRNPTRNEFQLGVEYWHCRHGVCLPARELLLENSPPPLQNDLLGCSTLYTGDKHSFGYDRLDRTAIDDAA